MARTVTQRRIDRNESILRDYQMHEPACPVRVAQKHPPTGQAKKATPVCICWLSEPVV